MKDGDGQRFYISQTSGYRSEHGDTYEHEYAVVDTASSHTVALFIADRPRYGREETFKAAKRGAHERARRYCVLLNKREARSLLSVPATNGVAPVRSEAGERLVLDDLSGVRRGNHLPVAGVHHDVAGAA